MQAVTITQITPPELELLIESSLKKILNNQISLGHQKAEDELLTVPQAAALLSVSVHTVYRLIQINHLPVMKRSKRCYFSKNDLFNYLKEGRKKTLVEIADETDRFLTNKK